MTTQSVPDGLGAGGRELWSDIASGGELDAMQRVQLLEACRAKDRLDKLDLLLRGDVDTWVSLTHRLQTQDYELVIDKALVQANSTANLMKQLLAAMRLPDEHGKRPQVRAARGAYSPTAKSGAVSSLDRARAAKAEA